MRWPMRNTLGVVIVAVATTLCPSCKTKQTTVETRDFSQNLRSSAAHHRLTLDDTITFFRFNDTDSGTVMEPERVIIRTTRVEQARHNTDTAAAVTNHFDKRINSTQSDANLPSWANETLYTLTLGVILLLLVTYIARKS